MITAVVEGEVWAALERVYDPCSVATRNPLSIVDMGLVRSVEVDEEGNVAVSVCPTAPSCMLMSAITDGARTEIAKVDAAAEISVEVDTEFFWTPEEMTERGIAQLDRYRAERSADLPKPLGLAKR